VKTKTYVGASMVASWCGVSRSAVTKWRERHASFPAPDIFLMGVAGVKEPGWLPERQTEIKAWHDTRRGQHA
jgi:hypothetical protein